MTQTRTHMVMKSLEAFPTPMTWEPLASSLILYVNHIRLHYGWLCVQAHNRKRHPTNLLISYWFTASAICCELHTLRFVPLF